MDHAQERLDRLVRMDSDNAFMAWLAAYLPDWQCEHSGDVLGMHDAFCAGRAGAKPETYQSILVANDPWRDGISVKLGTSQLTHALAKIEAMEAENAKLRLERSKFDAVHDWDAMDRELDRLRLYVKEIEMAHTRHIAREISDAHLSAE